MWEHNTHIGDARATDMAGAGMVNIGQLARESYGNESVYLVGFGSYQGTVIAAEQWSAPMQEMEVPPAGKSSIEAILHTEQGANGYLLFREEVHKRYQSALPHRAIGVVYDPSGDRRNYVPSVLGERYNAFIFLDQTQALHPLHMHPHDKQMPETYPFGV